MELTSELIGIMRHTARNRRFNGGGAEMDALVAMGLMECIGKPSWSPEPYFRLTEAGDAWLRENPEPTFIVAQDGKSITCLACSRKSHHPRDVSEKYCAHCKQFHPISAS